MIRIVLFEIFCRECGKVTRHNADGTCIDCLKRLQDLPTEQGHARPKEEKNVISGDVHAKGIEQT